MGRIIILLLLSALMGCSSGDPLEDNDMSSASVADDGTYLYRAWVDRRNGSEDIFFARSLDNGVTWIDEVKINDDFSGTTEVQNSPKIAVDNSRSGHVYAVWVDERSGNPDIWFASSQDSGLTWSVNFKVNQSNDGANQLNPSIDVYDRTCGVFVVWEDYAGASPSINFNRTLNDGQGWLDEDTRISDSGAAQRNPGIVTGRSCTVLAVWEEGANGNSDIHGAFNRGVVEQGDTMEPWNQPFVINQDVTDGDQSRPDITFFAELDDARDTSYYVVWQDARSGDYDIYGALVTIGESGEQVSGNVLINSPGTEGNQIDPSIGNKTLNSVNNLYVSWTGEQSGNADIYTAVSRDGNGIIWGSIQQQGVEREEAGQLNSDIPMDMEQEPLVVWEEELAPGIRNLQGARIFL